MKRERKPHSIAALDRALPLSVCSLVLLSGCMVGPKYVQPTVPPPPPAFKETPSNWKQANPQDQLPKGKWWEIYGDQQLDSLEEKIAVSNQNLKVAYEQYSRRAEMWLNKLVRSSFQPLRCSRRAHEPSSRRTGRISCQRLKVNIAILSCREISPTRLTSGDRFGEPSSRPARTHRRARAILRMSV